MGSSGKSAAGVRVQFTTEHNVALSMASLPVYREFEERYGLDVGYRAIGYLLLVPPERWESHLEAVDLQRRMGAPVEVLTPDEALRWVPFESEGLAGATFGPWDGVVDPHMATGAWVEIARRRGAEFRFGAPVSAIERRQNEWSLSVRDTTYSAPLVVNAAGAWSGALASMAGLQLPVVPKKVQIFLSGPVEDQRTYPLTIDLRTGVYLRSEGDRILFGRDNHQEVPGFSEGMEWSWLEQVLVTGMKRFPWFEDLGVDRKGSWWGYYEVTPDNSPIIGYHPDGHGWIDAAGFSGHGIMHAPATGSAVAALATSAPVAVGLHAFRHDRFGTDDLSADTSGEANVF